MRCKSNFLPFKTSKTSFLTPPVYSVFQTYPPPPKKKATTNTFKYIHVLDNTPRKRGN